MRRLAIAVAIVACIACGRGTLDRAHWQQMSTGEKTLYVRSLQGHDRARQSKGGNTVTHPLPPAEYVRAIDAAYARGDQRAVDSIFDGMAAATR